MEESGSSGADGTGQGFICLCSISGDADRWMYGCTQLLPWNNVITPINSHVTLDPPAGPETRIPPPTPFLFSLFLLTAAWICSITLQPRRRPLCRVWS